MKHLPVLIFGQKKRAATTTLAAAADGFALHSKGADWDPLDSQSPDSRWVVASLARQHHLRCSFTLSSVLLSALCFLLLLVVYYFSCDCMLLPHWLRDILSPPPRAAALPRTIWTDPETSLCTTSVSAERRGPPSSASAGARVMKLPWDERRRSFSL